MKNPIDFVKVIALKTKINNGIANWGELTNHIAGHFSKAYIGAGNLIARFTKKDEVSTVVALVAQKAVENEEKLSQFIALATELGEVAVEILQSDEVEAMIEAFGKDTDALQGELEKELDEDGLNSSTEKMIKSFQAVINIWNNKETSDEDEKN